MKPRITVVTVGVDDFERSLHVYRDATEFTLGHNVSSNEELDVAMTQA